MNFTYFAYANYILSIVPQEKKTLFYVTTIFIYIFVTVILASTIYALINHKIEKKRKMMIDYNTANVRVYSMNLKTNTVTFFDKKNMGKTFTITVDAFYHYFKNNDDATRVKNWIDDYVTTKKVSSNTITVTTKSTVDNKNSMSILKFTGYNPKTKILHFENIVLPKVKTNEGGFFSRRSGKGYSYIIKLDEANKLFENKKYKKKNISCIVIKIVPFNSEESTSSLGNSITSIYQPLNTIYKFLNKDRQLAFINDEEAVIFDTRLILHYDLNSLCQLIISEIQKYFSIRSLNNIYDITIGVSYYYPNGDKSLDDALAKARDLAKQASDTSSLNKIIYENDEEAVSENKFAIYKADIRKTILNKTFKVLYTPILSTELKDEYYVVSIEPYGTGFNSISELLSLSKKLNMLPNLFTTAFNKINIDLQNETINRDAIIFLSFNYIDDVLKAIKKCPDIATHLVIGFSFDELYDFYQADIEIEKKIESLKKVGIKTIIQLDLDTSTWFKDILEEFDMFIVSNLEVNSSSNIHLSSRAKDQLVFAYNSLKVYSKPIIIDNLNSIADIELADNIGYRSYICLNVGPKNSTCYQPDGFWKNKLEDDEKID